MSNCQSCGAPVCSYCKKHCNDTCVEARLALLENRVRILEAQHYRALPMGPPYGLLHSPQKT